MEENTFLDYNPQFGTQNGMGTRFPVSQYVQARNSEIESDGLQRWFNPGIAEAAQFDRENFMMDKENAFTEYMWNKSNAYNAAPAQMERGKEAGINANLMAAGIAGVGGNQAVPMAGASGNPAMNNQTINPIETLATLAGGINSGTQAAQGLGEIFGFGKKNKAEIKHLQELSKKTAEEMKYTRAQRKQLESIGQTLINNAKLEGNQIEQNVKNLKKLYEVYDQQKWNIAADTNQKEAETGNINEDTKTKQYENARLEFEKAFRDLFGMELTHQEMSMLVEACLNGKGEQIINYLTDTVATAIKGIKERIFEQGTSNSPKNYIKTTLPNKAGEFGWKIGNGIRKYFLRQHYFDKWAQLPKETRQRLEGQGIDAKEWIKIKMTENGHNGASGKW